MALFLLLLRLYSLCVAQWPWLNILPLALTRETNGASPVRPDQMEYG